MLLSINTTILWLRECGFQYRCVFHNTQYMVSIDKLRPYAACIYCAGFIKVIYYIYTKLSMPVDM